MPLLAFNTVLPQALRGRYQLALAALPIGLAFASFLPLIFIGSWLESALGVAPNSPVKALGNGLIWLALFLVTMVVLMLIGCTLGWLLNAVVARLFLGWSSDEIRAVFLRSEVPAHWLKAGTASKADATEEAIAKWEAQRQSGAVRFMVKRGVYAWGAPMFLAMYVVPTLSRGQTVTAGAVLFQIAIWFAGGVAFGAAFWYLGEVNYRRLKRRE